MAKQRKRKSAAISQSTQPSGDQSKVPGRWSSRKLAVGAALIVVGIAVEFISPRGLTEVVAAYLFGIAASYFAGNVVAKKYQGGGLTAEAEPAKPEAPSAGISPEEFVGAVHGLQQTLVAADQNSAERHALSQQSLETLLNTTKALIKLQSQKRD